LTDLFRAFGLVLLGLASTVASASLPFVAQAWGEEPGGAAKLPKIEYSIADASVREEGGNAWVKKGAKFTIDV
jgi:hypothetical protein